MPTSPVIPSPAEAKAALSKATEGNLEWLDTVAAFAPKLHSDTGEGPPTTSYAHWWVDVTQDGEFVVRGRLGADELVAAAEALALAASLGVDVVRAILMLNPPPVSRGHTGRANG